MQIAVIGPGKCSGDEWKAAFATGQFIARNNAMLVCGAHGGVGEAAAMGARGDGGAILKIAPKKGYRNQFLDFFVRAGIRQSRNMYVVQSSDAVIVVGNSYSAAPEISLALAMKRPVFGVNTRNIEGVVKCATPKEAVEKATGITRSSC